ncbi:hypothetical protein ATCC90586_009186 [Pythium insidiosum]|nr:hypothetical protein ATCC90586_009186 [Pythium insidiosum]
MPPSADASAGATIGDVSCVTRGRGGDTDSGDSAFVSARPRRSSSVDSAITLISDEFIMGSSGCCRGYSARMLFLMGCAMIEYASHTVILVLGPMIALHFYPATSYPRLGFYTALLSGSGYLGSALSCRLWINMARTLKSAKGVILWGLAILGAGFFSLLLCQSLLAMTIVRFAMGLFSGVTPVALIEIDNICGNRQTRLAVATKYVGVLIGAGATFLLVALGDKLFDVRGAAATEAKDETALYFYPLCFISMISWIAVVVTLVGLRMKSRASYVALNDPNGGSPGKHRMSALDDSPTGSPSFPVSSSLDRVKSAFEETFRRNRNPLKQLLMSPQPHFRTIRTIIPHYYHGYSESGHVVIWDFLGQIKMDRLTSAGFTTVDIRSHYQFFLQFALEKLIKSNNQKLLYIVDLEGLTLMDADDRVIEGAGVVISDLQKSFPDKLYQIAVINAPVWFSQVMAGVKPKIARKTIDKISFFPSSSTQQSLQDLIGVDSLPKRYGGRNGVEFGKTTVVIAILLKHITAAIATHGLAVLLDNSIAVDRRLIAHRAGHVVTYVAALISSGASPALFALLGYFGRSFPLDQSLLYFVQALGIGFLFLFSFLIPSRLNFPLLFAMNKR